MNKYKYKLLIKENEEETGSGLRRERELTLTTKGEYNADKILNVLSDPKYFEKTFVKKSGDKKEVELQIFGYPNIPANKKKNAELIAAQGDKPFYQEVEEKTGKKFTALQSNGLPAKTKSNNEIVDSYIQGSDKLDISPKKINDSTIKFPLKNESDIKKVLSNAGLTNKDYSLEKTEKLDESKIRNIIKENIKKLFNNK
jgi:hypothetical protein